MANLIDRFRQAVSSGDYARAATLWNSYYQQRLSEIERGCGEKLSEVSALIQWTRTVSLCFRALALHALHVEVTNVHAACAYANGGADTRDGMDAPFGA